MWMTIEDSSVEELMLVLVLVRVLVRVQRRCARSHSTVSMPVPVTVQRQCWTGAREARRIGCG